MLVAQSPTRVRSARLPGDFTAVHAMAIIATSWGACAVVWKNHEHESAEGFTERPRGGVLCRICTPGLALPEMRKEILRHFPGCQEILPVNGRFRTETVPEWFPQLESYLKDYYAASLRRWAQPQFVDNWAFWRSRLDWEQVSAFQRRVLEIVAAIPSGTHLTYGEIARQLNKPQAARAVGSAVGRNPWPVLVPCHRVLGANRSLVGFSAPGGIVTKQKMLDLEAG
jgi:O-6-methylguanine DNA methyltransferase